MTREQLIDYAGGLKLVELPETHAESLAREAIDLFWVELVLAHDFLNQALLFRRAVPLAILFLVQAKAVRWDETWAVLEALVDTVLQQLVELLTLLCHFIETVEFGLNGEIRPTEEKPGSPIFLLYEAINLIISFPFSVVWWFVL